MDHTYNSRKHTEHQQNSSDFSDKSAPAQQSNTTPTDLLEAAYFYTKNGFSVVPVNQGKEPTFHPFNPDLPKNDRRKFFVKWKHIQSRLTNNSELKKWFADHKPYGLGIVTGTPASGFLEVIDVDTKNQLPDTDLYGDYCKSINDHNPGLLKKLVIARTMSGGYHILFRSASEIIDGNKKLAERPATAEEKANGEKVLTLIETRGVGGYIAAFPTPGYKFIQGDITKIPQITAYERDLLIACAKLLDESPQRETAEAAEAEIKRKDFSDWFISPFEDYNEKAGADIPDLLIKNGWTNAGQYGDRIFLLRPGNPKSLTSGNFQISTRLFKSFSTSTEFEAGRAYNPVQVFTILNFGSLSQSAMSQASKELIRQGYGERNPNAKKKKVADVTAEDFQPETDLPTPLPEHKIETPDLPPILIPEPFRDWLQDAADAIQCPLDLPTIPAIIGAAGLIGNTLRIKPKEKDAWSVVPNLYGAVVSPPASAKTPAAKEGLRFVLEIEEKERQKYQKALKEAAFERDFAEAEKKAAKNSLEKQAKDGGKLDDVQKQIYKDRINAAEGAEAPKEKRLVISDSTIEKIGIMINDNPKGLTLYRDELMGLLRNCDKQGHESDRAFILEAWDGDTTQIIDRVGRESLYVKNLTLSIFGTIQPTMIEPYLRSAIEGKNDDGLIQRFQLLTYPNPMKEWKYVDRSPADVPRVRKIYNALHELNPADVKGAFRIASADGAAVDDRYYIRFTADAQEFFIEWITDLKNKLLRGEYEIESLRSHLSKYGKLMPALALIFHLIDWADADEKARENFDDGVSKKAAELAAAWCAYLEKHAAKLYGLATLSDIQLAAEILKHIKAGQVPEIFTARDIYGKHWARLSKPDDVALGLETLVDYGYLQCIPLSTNGRPTLKFKIHNSLLKGVKE